MLVRQAITFTYQGRPTGPRTELGAALANALLRDYATALGIQDYEGGTNYQDLDYGRASGYAMEWHVPDSRSWFDRLNTIGEDGNDGNEAFEYTPAIGKYRPVLNQEVLEGREIRVDLAELVTRATRWA